MGKKHYPDCVDGTAAQRRGAGRAHSPSHWAHRVLLIGLLVWGVSTPALGAGHGRTLAHKDGGAAYRSIQNAPTIINPTTGREATACTTRRFGDVTNDGILDLDDVLCVLDGFSGQFSYCPLAFSDIAPCGGGDGIINLDDIGAVLDAFGGNPFCDDSCVPCVNNLPPVSNAGSDFSIEVGEPASFNTTGTYDPDGVVAWVEWDFGDGSRDSNESASHTFTRAGVFTVRLTVTDSCNAVSSDQVTVTVTESICGASNASPTAASGADQSAEVGTVMVFSGSGSWDQDGTVEDYWWNFGDGYSTGWQPSPVAEHTYTGAGDYVVTLWVRDNCQNTSLGSTMTASVTQPVADTLDPVLAGFAKGSIGTTQGVALSADGRTLYAASQELGVVEIDVSDAYNPRVLRYAQELSGVQGVVVSDSLILTGGATNAARLVKRSLFATSNETWAALGFVAQGMALSGDTACVAAGASGMKVFDVSNPSNPQLRGSISMFARGVAISPDGRWAFVAAGSGANGGLKVVDLAASNPTVVSTLAPGSGGNAGDIVLSDSGDIAFLAESSAGLAIVDVSNPYQPLPLARQETSSGSANRVARWGDLVLVSTVNGSPKVHVFDVTNPANPVELGSTPGLYTDLATDGRFLYGAAANSGIRIVDLADPANPLTANFVPSGSGARTACATNGRVALVGGNTGRVTVLDVTQGSDPVVVSDILSVGQDIAMNGDLAYLASGASGLRITDVSDPTDPIILSTVPMFARGVSVSSDGRWAFVAAGRVSGYGRVNVVDVADPNNPVLVANVATGENGIASDIALNDRGTHAYVADFGAGLQIVDISDPRNPALLGLGLATMQSAQRVATSGDLVMVGTVGNGSRLVVMDVSNPLEPVELDSFPMMVQGAIGIYGNYALLPAGVFGMKILDFSDPGDLRIVTTVDTPGAAYSVAGVLDQAFIGDGTVVLSVVNLTGN